MNVVPKECLKCDAAARRARMGITLNGTSNSISFTLNTPRSSEAQRRSSMSKQTSEYTRNKLRARVLGLRRDSA